jgi:hypothetical protein
VRKDPLLAVVLACAGATLFHHVHNAEFLAEYPNMPAWSSAAAVYAAWSAATALGAIGYGLLRRGYQLAGVTLLIAYGCYCLDGLVHYALAPASAHSPMMHFSIGLEAVAGAALLVMLLRRRTQ